MLALLAYVALATSSAASDGFSREQAQALAERTGSERGVTWSDYVLAQARKDPNGEWLFTYECADHRADCRFLVVVNCKTERVTITSEVDKPRPAAIPDLIQESVFASEIRLRPGFVVCLAVAGSGVSKDLLSRLSHGGATVVDAKDCKSDTTSSYYQAAERKAIFYSIDGYEQTDALHAKLEFRSYQNGLDAEGVTLFLEFKDGAWVVLKRERKWIA